MRLRRYLLATALLLCLSSAPACEDKGPMEQMGEKIDDKVDEARDKLSGNQGTFEKWGEKIDDAAADAKEKIEEAEKRADDL